jgi:hypothetical protein
MALFEHRRPLTLERPAGFVIPGPAAREFVGGFRNRIRRRLLADGGRDEIELGHSLRFEVPRMGVFDGEIAGETMEGTFQDAEGAGSFRLEKQLAWDALPNGP